MATQTRTPVSPTVSPQVPWRPTGKLSRRLTRLIVVTALIAVVIGIALPALNFAFDYRAEMNASIEAAIEKHQNIAIEAIPIAFRAGATMAAQRIQQDTGAIAVRVLDYQGTVLGKFMSPVDAARQPDQRMPKWQRIATGYLSTITWPQLRTTRDLDINGDAVGSVEVVMSSGPFIYALLIHLAISLIAVIIVWVFAARVAARMCRLIAEPISRLLDVMDNVAHTQNYALRATPDGPDEIGSLTVSFNEMLKQIETRNHVLAEHRRKLQELVIERTKSFERAALEAETASRAKGDFLARMSHEIRTPMNGVVGMAELLENTRLEDQQHHMLQTMRSSADSLLDIINDILDFSRIEAGQLQVLKTGFSPTELLEEVCELLASRAHERDLDFVCDIDSKIPEGVTGDPLRLRQIVTNLLGNAIKYTEKGRIILRATAASESEERVVLRVEVEDTGLGIAEDQLPRMFEAFTQGDSFESRKHGGTGLGLAITKQLVTLLGGEVHVTSRLGAGSKFWITVPLGTQKNAPPAAHWNAGVKSTLVVQGDGPAAKVTARMLEAAGSRVWSAGTGHAAIDTMAIDEFGLVVVDELLPDMKGYELIDRIRAAAKSKNVAIVLMTSNRPVAAATEQVSEPDARVGKPLRRSRLREAVERALGRGTPAAAATQAASGKSRLNIRVLLVDDSPVNREVASGMLESLGCAVETASDGSIGIEQALSWGFDAVLMDCQMPLVDGFEATRRIRVAEASGGRKAMPIIALTANALQGDRERCLAAGMTDFISKPFTIKKLQAVLIAATGGAAGKQAVTTASAGVPAEANGPATLPARESSSGVTTNGQAQPTGDDLLPVVDAKQIAELRSLGRPRLVNDAIELFHKQALKNLDELSRALQAGNAPNVESNAHALKSCSLSVGARRFAYVAGNCEQAARNGDLAAAGQLASSLRPEYSTLSKALTEIAQEKVQAA